MAPAPRPRPRPRQKAAAVPSSSQASAKSPTSSQAESSSPSGPSKAVISIEDEDDMFLRNRGRTAQQWQKLRELTNKPTPVHKSDSDEDDSDDSLHKPRRKKPQPKRNDGPRWQPSEVAKILSSDDGSDSDIMIMDTPKPKTDIAPKKRKRSRSRSLTPPPELPVHRLMNARNVVRQALQAGGRAPSPTFVGDDSTDTIVLDPELLKIAEEVKKRTGPSTLINQNRGPEDVIMRVKWQPHPLDEAARSETWAYKMKRQSNFIELFDEVADAATVLVDRLFITYEGKRIYSSATPHNLKVWAEGELEACEQATYEYLRTHRHQPTPPTRQPEAAARSPSAAPLESDAESDAGSQTDDKFRLILRSSATKDITLTVRPTTTCGAIVKAFLKKAGLSDRSVPSSAKGPKKKTASVPHLVIDGDKMLPDTAIGDADLEDGDQVEVVGL